MTQPRQVKLRRPSVANANEPHCACATCPARRLNLCIMSKVGNPTTEQSAATPLPPQSIHSVRAGRLVWHSREWTEDVIFICHGWAISSIILEDGRRQILSLLLGGNLVSTASIFGALSGRSVEAVTDVIYRKFKRDDVRKALLADTRTLENISKEWIEEREQADQLAVDLGRRSAEERIARCILNVVGRLCELANFTSGKTIYFPLRRRHISDFTGLTTVHVSRILSKLRQSKLVEFKRSSLAITDVVGLRKLAQFF